jgi:hypothetical protein
VGLANLGSESEMCVGRRVRLVGVSISFEKNFYQLPFTPPFRFAVLIFGTACVIEEKFSSKTTGKCETLLKQI